MGDSPFWHPRFQADISVLLDIYNSSEYDPCAVCGLKGDSDRRKKKQKKIIIQGETNEYDHDKVGSSMLKKHKLFFGNVGTYRVIPIENPLLFADFGL